VAERVKVEFGRIEPELAEKELRMLAGGGDAGVLGAGDDVFEERVVPGDQRLKHQQ
jgi:hypothetical protein